MQSATLARRATTPGPSSKEEGGDNPVRLRFIDTSQVSRLCNGLSARLIGKA